MVGAIRTPLVCFVGIGKIIYFIKAEADLS